MGERAWQQDHVFSITSILFSLFPNESIHFPPLGATTGRQYCQWTISEEANVLRRYWIISWSCNSVENNSPTKLSSNVVLEAKVIIDFSSLFKTRLWSLLPSCKLHFEVGRELRNKLPNFNLNFQTWSRLT
jgi:hypothetical protein